MTPLLLSEAIELLLSYIVPIKETEMVDLWDAGDRMLADDIRAMHDQPPFPRSPLDGYALRAWDITGASREHPVRLRVVDEVCAGHVSLKTVTPGTAIRIMTGAPIPKGADCVIMQEQTDYGEDTVEIYSQVAPWQNYCPQGSDYREGTILLPKGMILTDAEIGILAGLGLAEIPVIRKPRVALITTGDETVAPGKPLAPGKIYDSNLYTVGAALRAHGAEFSRKIHVRDDAETVAQQIREAAGSADLIVTTGGVSVGKKDILHDTLNLLPAEQLFWKIAIKPGMPTLCGLYQGKLLICLSGNPYGAYANPHLLIRPLLARLAGRKDLAPRRVTAVADNSFPKKSKVARYVRAYYENGHVRMTGGSNESGVLSTLRGCNCLLEIPAGSESLETGTQVQVILL